MQVRVCRECGGEYFAHVAECADCGVPLEDPAARDAAAGGVGAMTGPEAPVREGNRDWLEELSDVLVRAGIPARVSLAPGCSAGTCGAKYILSVPFDRVSVAGEQIEAYYREVHPEVREAFENERDGRCPACGNRVGEDARECPDCGLMLVIEAEE